MTENIHVYQAIAAITLDLSKQGISKDRKNQQQNYAFRGIDDVYAALSTKLAEHKLCILPRVVDRSVTERQTKHGGTLFYTTLTVEFDFVSAVDGSKHVVRMIGEAMDSADKSSNKAMSAAYKYAALQAFCIPTEGDNDADSTTHELAPKKKKSAAEMKRGLQDIDTDLVDCDTVAKVTNCANIWKSIFERDEWSKDYIDEARKKFSARRDALKAVAEEVFPGDTPNDQEQ